MTDLINESTNYAFSYQIEEKKHIASMYEELKHYCEPGVTLRPKELAEWLEIEENQITYIR